MIREDEADAAVIDAELDARDAARDAAPAQAAPEGTQEDRPWWETDPRFAGRFEPVDGSVSPSRDLPSTPRRGSKLREK
jgi:hypothetical protein